MSETSTSTPAEDSSKESTDASDENAAEQEEEQEVETVPKAQLIKAQNAAKKYRKELSELRSKLSTDSESDDSESEEASTGKETPKERKLREKIAALSAELEKKDKDVQSHIIDGKRSDLFLKAGVLPDKVNQVLSLTKESFKTISENGKYVLDLADDVAELDPEEFVKNWLNDNPHFKRNSGKPGTGDGGGANKEAGGSKGIPAGFNTWSKERQKDYALGLSQEERRRILGAS